MVQEQASSTEPRDDRAEAVLAELAREGEARVAFQALRRQLDLHQQVLTRTLRRLEEDGLVQRDEAGYGLTEAGQALLTRPASAPAPAIAVAEALLPPQVSQAHVIGHLAKRWFDGLRWYGQVVGPDETTLIWHTEPSGQAVRVRLRAHAFTLELEGPTSSKAPYLSARGLLAALAELYGMDPEATGGHVVGLASGPGFAG